MVAAALEGIRPTEPALTDAQRHPAVAAAIERVIDPTLRPRDSAILASGDWAGPTDVAPEPSSGRVLGGRYLLKRQLGIGGFGAVFEAEDQRLHKPVAVKILSPRIAGNPEALARFRREAIAASQIGHEAIIDVTDFDQDDDGSQFIAMELLTGSDLSRILETVGPLDPHRALALTSQIALALAAAHDKGILHRDLKPANIYVTPSPGGRERVKVIDFGISKIMQPTMGPSALTATGQILGTPFYMPPEQASGKFPIGPPCDVYALGVMLFEMLTGTRPFTGNTYLEIVTKHLTASVTPPSEAAPELELPPIIDELVVRALRKDPRQRYPSMRAYNEAILGVSRSLSSSIGDAGRRVPEQRSAPQSKSREGQVPSVSTLGHASGQLGRSILGETIVGVRGRRARYIAASGIAAVVLTGGLVLAIHGASDDTTPPRPERQASARTAEPEVTAAAQPDAAPAADHEIVRLVTNPSADVIVNGMRVGTTPHDLEVATGDNVIEVRIERAGYLPIERAITATDAPEIVLDLVRVRRSRAGRNRSTRSQERAPKPPTSAPEPAGASTATKSLIIEPAPDDSKPSFEIKPIGD